LASVPSVLMIPDKSPADWSRFYDALEKMSVAEANVAAGINGRVLGLTGIPGTEEAAFAAANLDALLDDGEDALADQAFAKATVVFKKALYLARISGNSKAEDNILKKLVDALYQRREYVEALRYKIIAANKLKPVSNQSSGKDDEDKDPVDYANTLVEASVLAVLGQRFNDATKIMDEAEVIFANEGMTDQLGKIWQYRGINFENQLKYEDTIAAYKKSEQYYRKRKPEEAANQLLRIGNVYNRFLSNYQLAINYYDQLSKIFKHYESQTFTFLCNRRCYTDDTGELERGDPLPGNRGRSEN